jgi:CzcA family heavy metal efflux pump
MNLLHFCHRHARALLFTVAALAASGVAMMLHLPLSLFPDVVFPRIVILADNGEQPAERMMVEVTKPLEEVATALPGVQYVRSKTSRGSSEISIGLHWGVDVERSLEMLQGRIGNIRNRLPLEAVVRAEQMTVAVFPIAGYSLTSDSLSQVKLREIAFYQIRPALLRVNGVARVEVAGGETREYLIDVDPAKLNAYRLTIQQVSNAVQMTNLVGSTGLVSDNHQLYLSLVSGLVKNEQEISRIVVVVRNGAPITIGDVATVLPSHEDQYIRTTARGRDAVLISVLKQPTGSTVQIGSEIEQVFKSISLPRGVVIENFYDQAGFIGSSIAGVRDSIIVGVLLAMVIVWFFLRSWRLMTVVLVIVPVTVAMTFLALGAAGKSINIMTLGGIAAAIGLIIDDAIVIVEYIFSRHAAGVSVPGSTSDFMKTTGDSLRHLMPAIVGSTASTIVIHIPLAFLGGVTGAFFSSLSITMVFALLISFLLSVTMAPLMSTWLLRTSGNSPLRREQEVAGSLTGWYERIMRKWLGKKTPVLLLIGLVLALTFFLFGRLGTSFMPDMDEGTFVLDYRTPFGTDLAETSRMLKHIESALLTVPEVESYSRRTGTELGFFITEPNSGDFAVKLKARRSRSIQEVISDVRNQVHELEPMVSVDFGQMMMDVVGDLTNNPSPIEIKLFSEDQALLRRKSAEIADAIQQVPGVVDVFDGIVISGSSFVIRVDAAKAAIAGFSVQDILGQVQNIMEGRVDSKIQMGERVIGVKVRFPDAFRHDLVSLESLALTNPQGKLVPIRTIATLERSVGETEITRDQLQQMVAVTARIEGRDIGSTVAEIRSRLHSSVVLDGITVEFGGVYQTQQESFAGLLAVILAALLLVLVVLLFEFEDFAVPVSILLLNGLSLAGVFLALFITGETLNVSSLVGVVMIIGIVAENAIFALHIVKNERRPGETLDGVLVRALSERARPIIMTTLAAVLALLPLSLGLGAGSQLQRPLAIAIIGGFSVSSLLLFFVLPPVYRMLHFRKT